MRIPVLPFVVLALAAGLAGCNGADPTEPSPDPVIDPAPAPATPLVPVVVELFGLDATTVTRADRVPRPGIVLRPS